ncbi:hypothetical protein QTG90_11020 [Clostridium perfringens]|nr:hypothetical protein [Clostridium perfringens]
MQAESIGTAKEHDLVINEGAIYLGDFSNITPSEEFITGLASKLLGVFQDKMTISAKPKIRQIKNAAMLEKGWQTVDKWEAKITGNLLDFNSRFLEASLFKKVTESETTKYVATMGLIDSTQYKDALIVGYKIDDTPVIVYVRDILNTEGLAFDLKGQDEAGLKLSLENAYSGRKTNPVEVYGTFKDMTKAQV